MNHKTLDLRYFRTLKARLQPACMEPKTLFLIEAIILICALKSHYLNTKFSQLYQLWK